MIHISGSVCRSFAFPAPLPLAFAYFSDLGRILTYLPHIFVVRAYRYDQFRMLYSTTELGVYHIRIFCDLQARLEKAERTLTIRPMEGCTPAKPAAGVKSATASGLFSSQSAFRPDGDGTAVTYSLRLEAKLPKPTGLRLMPDSVVNRIAQNITRWRIREVAEGFIGRSIDAYPFWLAEIEGQDLPPLKQR
jgi:hypothetical protein